VLGIATRLALRFFFGVTLNRADALAKMNPVREPRTLPLVLIREEVRHLIESAGNLKSTVSGKMCAA
jgi:hypothetical protein